MLASVVPKLVIKESVAAEMTQEREIRKNNRRHDEEHQQCANRSGTVEPAIQDRPPRDR